MDMHKIIDLMVAGDETARSVFSDELAKQIQTMVETEPVIQPSEDTKEEPKEQ